ncbi:hypothetical protein Hanom_Chr11g01053671 [Helianthus anomalus]
MKNKLTLKKAGPRPVSIRFASMACGFTIRLVETVVRIIIFSIIPTRPVITAFTGCRRRSGRMFVIAIIIPVVPGTRIHRVEIPAR